MSRPTESRKLALFTWGISCSGLLLAAAPSQATTTVSVPASDTGNYCVVSDPVIAYRCTPSHNPNNTDYTTGYIDIIGSMPDLDIVYRGFFVFNLNQTAITDALDDGQRLASATVRTRNFDIRCGLVPVGSACPSPAQSIGLYGILGTVPALINGSSNFNNLGQGPTFASVSFPEILPTTSVSTFSLNGDGLDWVESFLRNDMAISTRNSDEVGEIVESPVYVYGNSSSTPSVPSVYLDLTFVPATNVVPAPLPMLGPGAAWCFSRRLRRRCR